MSEFRKVSGVQRHHDFAAGERFRGPYVGHPSCNHPRAGQWTSAMSHMMVADYKPFVMTDGEGIRCSLYVSGCPFRCDECYNASIWDFRAGSPYTDQLQERILDDVSNTFVQGLTLLGGEPMLNTGVVLPLVRALRERFGNTKDVWCWTGYTFEELMRPGESADKHELLELIDVLVDGRYIHELHDSLLQFRGSSNQRILDVPASLAQGQPVQWAKLHDQQRFIPALYAKDRAEGERYAS